MRIKQFEQSGFIIETNSSFTLALDIGSYTPIEKLEGIKVDGMIVSHLHGDHFSLEQIKKLSPKKLYLSRECIALLGEESIAPEIVEVKMGDALTIGDASEVKVQIFTVDHGPNIKIVPKENFGFLFEVDGEKVYFAGDMFAQSGIDVSELEVDYALIPVGTFYTFGPDEALAFAKKFKRIGKVIPMHYEKTPETKDVFVALAKEAGFTA